ncbi:J domain-containing protein [Paenibacillus sp. CC-CFT747]|nr:J domain-containing protein [Paenibacillus sp. CC-CFT747]
MTLFENYYEVLRIRNFSTKQEIKQGFRSLAKIKHPDVGGSDKEFIRIRHAYEILSNDLKREAYDRELRIHIAHHTQNTQQSGAKQDTPRQATPPDEEPIESVHKKGPTEQERTNVDPNHANGVPATPFPVFGWLRYIRIGGLVAILTAILVFSLVAVQSKRHWDAVALADIHPTSSSTIRQTPLPTVKVTPSPVPSPTPAASATEISEHDKYESSKDLDLFFRWAGGNSGLGTATIRYQVKGSLKEIKMEDTYAPSLRDIDGDGKSEVIVPKKLMFSHLSNAEMPYWDDVYQVDRESGRLIFVTNNFPKYYTDEFIPANENHMHKGQRALAEFAKQLVAGKAAVDEDDFSIMRFMSQSLGVTNPAPNPSSQAPSSSQLQSTTLSSTDIQKDTAYITLGLGKEAIRKLMGSPTSDFGSIWMYESDTLNFDDSGKLIGYTNFSGKMKIRVGDIVEGAPPFNIGSTKKKSSLQWAHQPCLLVRVRMKHGSIKETVFFLIRRETSEAT